MANFNSENEFQNRLFVSLVAYENKYSDMFVYHVPNGGFRDKLTAKIMQWIGLRKGVSDLHVMGGGKILFLELKIGKGIQSNEQMVFEGKVKKNGMVYWLINDSEPIELITERVINYLYNPQIKS